jgi:hypothetical protein
VGQTAREAGYTAAPRWLMQKQLNKGTCFLIHLDQYLADLLGEYALRPLVRALPGNGFYGKKEIGTGGLKFQVEIEKA